MNEVEGILARLTNNQKNVEEGIKALDQMDAELGRMRHRLDVISQELDEADAKETAINSRHSLWSLFRRTA